MYERSDRVIQIKIAENTYLAKVWDHFYRAVFHPFEKRICRFWVSGSSVQEMIRGKENDINDYDLYFPNDINFWVVKNELENKGMKVRYETDNVIRFGSEYNQDGVGFDLVKRFYSTPTEFIEDFDFTVCGFAFCQDGYFYCKVGSLIDLAGNKLVMENKDRQEKKRIEKYWNKKRFDRWPQSDFLKIQNATSAISSGLLKRSERAVPYY